MTIMGTGTLEIALNNINLQYEEKGKFTYFETNSGLTHYYYYATAEQAVKIPLINTKYSPETINMKQYNGKGYFISIGAPFTITAVQLDTMEYETYIAPPRAISTEDHKAQLVNRTILFIYGMLSTKQAIVTRFDLTTHTFQEPILLNGEATKSLTYNIITNEFYAIANTETINIFNGTTGAIKETISFTLPNMGQLSVLKFNISGLLKVNNGYNTAVAEEPFEERDDEHQFQLNTFIRNQTTTDYLYIISLNMFIVLNLKTRNVDLYREREEGMEIMKDFYFLKDNIIIVTQNDVIVGNVETLDFKPKYEQLNSRHFLKNTYNEYTKTLLMATEDSYIHINFDSSIKKSFKIDGIAIASILHNQTVTALYENTFAYIEQIEYIQCPLGYQSVGGNCVQCDRGYHSPEVGYCTGCLGGTYAAFPNETTCSFCPKGTISEALAHQCTACAIGTYNSKENQKTCIPCPTGKTTLQTKSIDINQCVECQKGTSGINICTQCAKGTYQDETGQSTCKACPTGQTTAAPGAISINDCEGCPIPYYGSATGVCHLCPHGTFSTQDSLTTETQCQSCPPGTASITGPQHTNLTDAQWEERKKNSSMACLPCNEGHYAGERTGTCIPCPTGTYNTKKASTSSENCTLCPAGTYSITTGNIREEQCLPCRAGSYSSIKGRGSDSCITCPEGYFSTAIGATNASTCQKCPIGTFNSQRGASVCELCAEGTFALSEGSQLCTPCPAGTYGKEKGGTDASTCLLCPAGTYSDEQGAQQCSACPNGTYSEQEGLSSSLFCLKCPFGSYSTTTCTNCPLTTCTLCEKGTYNNEIGQSFCKKCPKGTYQDEEGMQQEGQCKKCPAGTYGETEGLKESSACSPCPPGYQSDKTGATGIGVCQPCQRGEYASDVGSKTCLKCSKGYYAPVLKSAACVPCPSGTFNPIIGGTNQSVCIKCPAGTGSAILGATSNEVCGGCPSGMFLDGSKCSGCPAGYHAPVNAQTLSSKDDCIKCPLGHYQDVEGALDTCKSCPQGTFANETALKQCHLCPQGTFNDQTKQESPSACKTCPEGRISSKGAFGCTPCDMGKFSNSTLTEKICLDCPKGSFSSARGSPKCTPCPAGSYGNIKGASQCTLCPFGFYSTNIGQTSANTCQACPKGSSTVIQGAMDISQCQACPAGTYLHTKINVVGESVIESTTCEKCPSGTYSVVAGESLSSCLLCPSGTYNPSVGSTSVTACQLCPSGTFNPNEGQTTEIGCIPCPAGSFGILQGATSETVCQPCSAGTYSFGRQSICTACPTGTYNPHTQSTSSTFCQICPNNTATLTIGSTSISDCLLCPRGQYKDAKGACIECPGGTYSDVEAAISISACKPCGKGKYSKKGSPSASSCQFCPAGSYNENDIIESCISCKEGYFSTIVGSISEDNCQPCPVGTFNEKQRSNSSLSCTPCVPGTYQNKTGSGTIKDCILCPLGTFAPEKGSERCTICSIEGCSYVGASTFVDNTFLKEERQDTIDPRIANSTNQSESLRNLLLTIFIPICVLLVGCIPLIPLVLVVGICTRCRCGKFFKHFDILFAFRHRVQKYNPLTNNPTGLGGMFSYITILVTGSLMGLVLVDFFTNNSLITESFRLENLSAVSGKVIFSVALMGEHKTCDATILSKSISGSSITPICEQIHSDSHKRNYMGIKENLETSNAITGCYCQLVCESCVFGGSNQQVSFNFNDFVFTPLILYHVSVPHYEHEQYYVINGTLIPSLTEERYFTGTESPTELSFSLTKTKFQGLPQLHSIFSVFSTQISATPISLGYTNQLIGKSLGTSYKNDQSFFAREGLHVNLHFQQSASAYIVEEHLKQNILQLVAQVFALFSAIVALFAFVLKGIEFLLSNTPTRVSSSKMELIPADEEAPRQIDDEGSEYDASHFLDGESITVRSEQRTDNSEFPTRSSMFE
eukprot:CAMPEP_0117420708 /NCGR_PEP_ID=MMETSP0758-20121206/1983_1 /TAXON_ID=63605 /ORGANISM="Percolomonas cosmopolitus, Strain AE-1 (ATCC 50343)" /LENGTH=1928 /DNA_ID=CAMNT_0005202469 /DNA_START=3044 /DNA_END=8830 /DNA_ORIENTATION=-